VNDSQVLESSSARRSDESSLALALGRVFGAGVVVSCREVAGTGHLIGRQYSVVTDEPIFRSFTCVMEGNNEVDIDSQPRKLDYLGTEDSFTFSWGFQRTFAGLRAGLTRRLA
jgi:hypothetical protein